MYRCTLLEQCTKALSTLVIAKLYFVNLIQSPRFTYMYNMYRYLLVYVWLLIAPVEEDLSICMFFVIPAAYWKQEVLMEMDFSSLSTSVMTRYTTIYCEAH